MTQHYSSDDVQNILQRAIALQYQNTFSHDQLLEMASEAGVSTEQLQQAEQEWRIQREAEAQQERRRSRHRLGFRAHLIPYLLVSTFLVLLNLSTTPRHFWSIYPLLGWGLGVALHGAAIHTPAKPH